MQVVAIVGRPNVGKSTLFNKLVGQRLSIVDDKPGVTRDRIYSRCEWLGREFMLIDTGGIEPKTDDVILAQMREQAMLAVERADAIIFVTDITTGVTANDSDVASMLIKSGKPVVLAVNKVDGIGTPPPEIYEFYNLGLGDPIAVSSVHGHGTGDLLDAGCAHLDFSETGGDEDRIPVAIIGRPNVGKSSLTNRILGENRMIVANEAGTTRDAIDTKVENKSGKHSLADIGLLLHREDGGASFSLFSPRAACLRVDARRLSGLAGSFGRLRVPRRAFRPLPAGRISPPLPRSVPRWPPARWSGRVSPRSCA